MTIFCLVRSKFTLIKNVFIAAIKNALQPYTLEILYKSYIYGKDDVGLKSKNTSVMLIKFQSVRGNISFHTMPESLNSSDVFHHCLKMKMQED